MRFHTVLTVLVALVLFAGCGDDVQCGEGTELRDGSCVILEDAGADADVPGPNRDSGGPSCGTGTRLVGDECVPTASKNPIGSACASNEQCESGTCAPNSETLPGGYCTVLGCSMDNPCPRGSTCYSVNKDLSICMAYCDRDTECRDDYHCQPLYTNGVNICAPSCEVSKSCTAGTRCNPESGLCELAECEVGASDDGCSDDETCYTDSRGLSSKGGLCLNLCDPESPEDSCVVAKSEVCQPLANDPSKGFCAPPVCSKTEECPAGAECQDRVCMPPALCDGDSPCPDDRTCVSGKCMRKCPSGDDSCSDVHPGLVCADVLAVPACLPVGAFPGSACRATTTNRCDSVGGAAMVCQDEVCLVDCTSGGDALCSGLSASLSCARGVFEKDLCLPKGTYPGSACGANNTCGQDLGGDPNVDMACVEGTCVITCSETGKWPGYGDALCSLVDSSLTCATSAGGFCVPACGADNACGNGFSCFDPGALPEHENACLPVGTFPGSSCRPISGDQCDSDLGGNAAVDMECVNDTCVVSCGTNNDALCQAVDASLTCSETASDVCVVACGDEGACPSGYACFDAGVENACLPTGSFPGSACRDSADNKCDQNVGGNDAFDLVCVGNICTPACPNNNDALCQGIDASLTCSESAGSVCVIGCISGACLPGYDCLEPGTGPDDENACLPNGSFPGSACRDSADNKCDQNVGGNEALDLTCAGDTCTALCPNNNDALCTGLSTSLTCSESAGNLCVVGCVSGNCLPGFSCLAPGAENACLPTGSFPGSPCRATIGDECDEDLAGNTAVDLTCVQETCVVGCSGNNDALCAGVDESLTCSESAGDLCVVACDEGECPDGFSCLDPGGESACLPTGSFPGSPCRETGGDECDQNLLGNPNLDMVCTAADLCTVSCPGDNNALCGAVDSSLTCAGIAGNLCLPACGEADACPQGFNCYTNEDVCLPAP